MPTIRATVTVDEAMPYGSRATASTAAVERGVTVSPKPAPNTASAAAADPIGRRGRPARHHDERARSRPPARCSVTRRSDRIRTTNPDTSAPTAVAAGERAERQALLVGPAVEHAVDEHRAADDRRREAVARQRRDRRSPRRSRACRNSRGSRNGSGTRSPRTTRDDARDDGDHREDGCDTSAGSRPPAPGLRAAAEQRQRAERPDEERREQHRADDVDPARPPRRLPAAARGPRDDERPRSRSGR